MAKKNKSVRRRRKRRVLFGIELFLQISHKFFQKVCKELGISLRRKRVRDRAVFLPAGRITAQSGKEDV